MLFNDTLNLWIKDSGDPTNEIFIDRGQQITVHVLIILHTSSSSYSTNANESIYKFLALQL